MRIVSLILLFVWSSIVFAQNTPPIPEDSTPPIPVEEPAKPRIEPSTATIRLTVPSSAQVWFDDILTTRTGTQREYVTPPFDVKGRYEIKVVFKGQVRRETVIVNPGDAIQLLFFGEEVSREASTFPRVQQVIEQRTERPAQQSVQQRGRSSGSC